MYIRFAGFSFKNAIKGSVSERYRDQASNPDLLNKGLTAPIECHPLCSSSDLLVPTTSLVAMLHIMLLLYSGLGGFQERKSWSGKWGFET